MENRVIPAVSRLTAGFRALGAPVIYTRCTSPRLAAR